MDGKQICRLCLNMNDNEIDEIDETMRGMLEVLLLEVDFSITENPTICRTCADIIKRSFYFKSACVHTEKLIVSFVINKEKVEFDFEDIDHDKGCIEMVVEESFMCRFCMNRINKNNVVPVDILMEESMYKEMLPVFMPEMGFTIVKDRVVCTPCRENLECYFLFIKNCLGIENELYEYCRNAPSNRSGRIKLVDVFHFLFDGNSRQFNKYAGNHPVKRELTSEELLYSCNFMNIEEILGANEKGWLNEDPHEHLSEVGLDTDRYPYEQSKLAQSNIRSDMDTYSQNMSTSETEQSQYCERDETPKSNSDTCKCPLCPYTTKSMAYVKRHMLVHKDTSEIRIYKCDLCPYSTRYKNTLRQHGLVHKDASEMDMYKCQYCDFKTKWKRYLKSHITVHKDITEVDMYKCSRCSYQTKLKAYLHRHMLVHKDASEVVMYKCEFCAYMTKYKRTLQQHMLTHKDASEVDIYKCPHCPYETKWKRYLKDHIVVHKDAPDIKIYKCESCIYTTKSKRTLKQHALIHKMASEIEMYKCTLCPYESKWKSHLKRHHISHKDTSELEMYNCPICNTQFKCKQYIKRHMLTHKDGSELETYKCAVCNFQTKYRNNLTRHMLFHSNRDVPKSETYNCPMCSFQTRHKHYVKEHMLMHKEATELEMYKCTLCTFETKYKRNLNKHMHSHAQNGALKAESNM